jgi:hypothetical protein
MLNPEYPRLETFARCLASGKLSQKTLQSAKKWPVRALLASCRHARAPNGSDFTPDSQRLYLFLGLHFVAQPLHRPGATPRHCHAPTPHASYLPSKC